MAEKIITKSDLVTAMTTYNSGVTELARKIRIKDDFTNTTLYPNNLCLTSGIIKDILAVPSQISFINHTYIDNQLVTVSDYQFNTNYKGIFISSDATPLVLLKSTITGQTVYYNGTVGSEQTAAVMSSSSLTNDIYYTSKTTLYYIDSNGSVQEQPITNNYDSELQLVPVNNLSSINHSSTFNYRYNNVMFRCPGTSSEGTALIIAVPYGCTRIGFSKTNDLSNSSLETGTFYDVGSVSDRNLHCGIFYRYNCQGLRNIQNTKYLNDLSLWNAGTGSEYSLYVYCETNSGLQLIGNLSVTSSDGSDTQLSDFTSSIKADLDTTYNNYY